MRLSHDLPSRLCRGTFALLMTLAWCGAARPGTALAQNRPAAPNANPEPEVERRMKQASAVLRRVYDIGRRELAQAGADPSDVKAKAAELGHDPDRLFAFVRDEVRYEPYRGVLRGARGALLARAANATDKSLLLQEMLEAGGHACRLVRGALPAEDAAALVAQFLKPAPLAGPMAEMAAAEANGASTDGGAAAAQFVQKVATETGIDPAALQATLASGRRQGARRTADAWAAVEREAPPLVERLKAADVTLGLSFDGWQAELLDRATQHVWVELSDGAGGWVALDPSFAGSQRGKGRAEGEPLTIAEAEEHRVVLRLVYRRAAENSDQPEEVELINVPLPARRAAFDGAALAVNPADPLPPPSKLAQMKPEEVVRTLAAVEKFQPVLRLGGESFYGKPFDLKGNLFEVSADGRIEGATKVGGAVGGLFGGALGGGDAPAEKKNTFAGLAVTLDLLAPGAKPARQERVLLTAADVAGEHRKSALLSWDLLVQPHPISFRYASHRTMRQLLAALAPLAAAAEDAAVAPAELDAIASARTEPFSPLLTGLALMRQGAVARQLAEAPAVAALWDTPLVAVAERTACMNPRAGHACGQARIDIVENALAFVPREGGAAPAAAAARAALRQGVFDTAAEALALRDAVAGPGSGSTSESVAPAVVASPLDDFARARAAGDAMTVYRVEAGAAPPAGLALAEADRNWVARYERPGHVVVAPSRPAEGGGPQGWWTVDPATGSVLGRHAGGRGQALSEKALITNAISFSACMASPFIDAVKNPKGTAAGLKIGLNMAGCVIGLGFGLVGGVYNPATAESLALAAAIIGALFTAADKALG